MFSHKGDQSPREKYSLILDLGFGTVESGNILAIFLLDLISSLAPGLFILEASLRIIHAAILAWRVAKDTSENRLSLIIESMTATALVVGVMLVNFLTISLSTLFMPIVFLSICIVRTMISFVAAFHYWHKSNLINDPVKKQFYLEKAKRNAIGFIAGCLTTVAVAFALVLAKISWTIAGIVSGVISCFYLSYKFCTEISKTPEEIPLDVFSKEEELDNVENFKDSLKRKYSCEISSTPCQEEVRNDLNKLMTVIIEKYPDFDDNAPKKINTSSLLLQEFSAEKKKIITEEKSDEIKASCDTFIKEKMTQFIEELEIELPDYSMELHDAKKDEDKIDIFACDILDEFQKTEIPIVQYEVTEELSEARKSMERLHQRIAERNFKYEEEDETELRRLDEQIKFCNKYASCIRLFKDSPTSYASSNPSIEEHYNDFTSSDDVPAPRCSIAYTNGS